MEAEVGFGVSFLGDVASLTFISWTCSPSWMPRLKINVSMTYAMCAGTPK